MNSVKRLGMVAVLVVGVGLLASTTARADTFELVNVGDEPLATGHVSYGALKLVKLPPDIPPPVPTLWQQKITISCRSLTPGATYWTTAGTFTADRNGNGKVSAWVLVDPNWRWVSVERLNADGSWTTVLAASGSVVVAQAATMLPAPPPGEVWVYPTGVFPDDFYALWLAVNGAPYASGDLPFPYYDVPDNQPDSRPVFVGNPLPNGKWTVVLKARRLDAEAGGQYVEGAFTAFNLGLAAGTEVTKDDPVFPVVYLLETGKKRFSTGFGEVNVRRAVNIQGEATPDGEEQFFGYTPNFDPAANPDTNPEFDADWLPADYPLGSEYEPGQGYGVKSTKTVIYGGNDAFHVRPVRVDFSVNDCLLYGQYSMAIRIDSAPSRLQFSNLDIRHTYHQLVLSAENKIGMLSWAIYIQSATGGGGKHLIKGCYIDQSPTWQEYYFGANPKQWHYRVGNFPGGHAVFVSNLSKQSPGDSVRIERSTMKNCGSNVIVYNLSDVDLLIANCLIDGGYFAIPLTEDSVLPDWRGNCIAVIAPSADSWGNSPVIQILANELIARGWSAWGVRLFGCGNGEAEVADNVITCASASPAGYAGGVQLFPSNGVGSNRNTISENTFQGTGGWAISVNAYDFPCEENSFVGNDLSGFSAQEAGAVLFGPLANYNFYSGDVGAGIIDLGTGNVVE